FGSAWQQFNANGRFLNDFSLGGSVDLGAGFALGGTFDYLQFLDGQGGNSANFGLGALYRPTSWLAAGFTLNNLANPAIGNGTLAREYRAGLALRPIGDRLTLSLDGLYREGDPWSSVTPWLGLEAEVLPGVSLRGMVDNQLEYSVGLGLDLGQVSGGFLSGISRGRVGASDLVYATSSDSYSSHYLELGQPHLAYIRMEGDLRDVPQNAFDLRQQFYPGVLHLTQRIRDAQNDPKITGVVLDLHGVSAGLGKIEEIRQAVDELRASGKTAIAYVYDPDISTYYLASACDKVIQNPSGTLDLTGLSESVPFFKGLFGKLGIEPQFVPIGKYKSAPEQFTRDKFSAPGLKEAQDLIDAQYAHVVAAIAKDRRLTPSEVESLVKKGLFTPAMAKERGLVDEIGYPDQVPGLVAKGFAPDYPLKQQKPATWAHPEKIAVVSIDGTISRGESGANLMDGQTVGSGTITNALRDIRHDDDVKAVVVYVNSPGGDSLASDEIGRELDLLRLANKPVIICMGDLAASGGYWVSANGTRIYAEPSTITGSIGVFAGQFAYGGLLNKLGITTQTIKRGPHADMDSGFRPLTPEEVDMLRDQARYTYAQFLQRVSKGRRMATDRVDAIAQGHVWAGSKALDLGLVDRMGNLETAIGAARKMSNLDPKTSTLDFYPKPGALWETINNSSMDEELNRTVKAAKDYSRAEVRLLMPPMDTPSGK
ncbi:MAG TPA: signal peptide peptidase SppA, partial [Oscillatoriaceae cyanobacterium]